MGHLTQCNNERLDYSSKNADPPCAHRQGLPLSRAALEGAREGEGEKDREGGREGEREKGRERGSEAERERKRERGREGLGEGGREGERERHALQVWAEKDREGGREGERGERERGREGERESGRAGGIEGERESGREGERERGRQKERKREGGDLEGVAAVLLLSLRGERQSPLLRPPHHLRDGGVSVPEPSTFNRNL